MKKPGKYLILVFFVVLTFVSCVLEKNSEEEIQGDDYIMDILISNGAEETKAFTDPNVVNESEYAVNKVRLYVFNVVSGTYVFEKTALFTGSQITSKTQTSCKVKITVKEKANNKKIIAILNEPDRLTATLNKYTKLDEIKNIQYDFISDYAPKTAASLGHSSGIFSIFGNAAPAYTLPFYGESGEFIALKNVTKAITINVKRAVARIDLYIKNSSLLFDYYFAKNDIYTLVDSIKTTSGTQYNYSVETAWTQVAAVNCYKKGYLYPSTLNTYESFALRYIYKSTGLRSSQVPLPTDVRVYSLSGGYKIGTTDTRICHFYLPEISTTSSFSLSKNAPRIVLQYPAITDKSGRILGHPLIANRAVITLPDFVNLGKLTKIERNKVYKIFATITDKGMSVTVKISPWVVNEKTINL